MGSRGADGDFSAPCCWWPLELHVVGEPQDACSGDPYWETQPLLTCSPSVQMPQWEIGSWKTATHSKSGQYDLFSLSHTSC